MSYIINIHYVEIIYELFWDDKYDYQSELQMTRFIDQLGAHWSNELPEAYTYLMETSVKSITTVTSISNCNTAKEYCKS